MADRTTTTSLPKSPNQFRAQFLRRDVDTARLGDIDDETKRPRCLRFRTLNLKLRTKLIALSGSTAGLEDALFLRPILSELTETETLKVLKQYGYISDAAIGDAESELCCKVIDWETCRIQLTCPNEPLPKPHSQQHDHSQRAFSRPRSINITSSRRAYPFLRDLDDFVETLDPSSARGTREIFNRKDTGPFFPAAKMYETYKSFDRGVFTPVISQVAHDWLRSHLKTPERVQGVNNVVGMHTNTAGIPEPTPSRLTHQDFDRFDMDLTDDGNELPHDGTLTGQPDEERETNFATAWWNDLSSYHDSTRAFCTLVPDRVGFDLVIDNEPSIRGPRLRTNQKRPQSFKLFTARADAMVLRKGPTGPVSKASLISPANFLLTAEFKPPSEDGKVSFHNVEPQIVLELAARISALHNPQSANSLPVEFPGSKSVLLAAVCGFEFVLLLAEYSSPWVKFAQNGTALVLEDDMDLDDFLRLKKLIHWDLKNNYNLMHPLNVLILAIFIQEYQYNDSTSDEDGAFSAVSHKNPYNLQQMPKTPLNKEKEREQESITYDEHRKQHSSRRTEADHKRKASSTLTSSATRDPRGPSNRDRERASQQQSPTSSRHHHHDSRHSSHHVSRHGSSQESHHEEQAREERQRTHAEDEHRERRRAHDGEHRGHRSTREEREREERYHRKKKH